MMCKKRILQKYTNKKMQKNNCFNLIKLKKNLLIKWLFKFNNVNLIMSI